MINTIKKIIPFISDLSMRITLVTTLTLVLAFNISAETGGQGGPTFETGYVTTRALVRGEQGFPIFAEFDESGEVVNIIGEAVGNLKDAQVMSIGRYNALVQQANDFREQNKNGSARGSYYVTAETYNEMTFKTSIGDEEVNKPTIKESTKSVLVRGKEALRSKLVNPVLLESEISLPDAPDFIPNNIVSLLLDDEGRIIQQSENNVGYRTAFFEPADSGFDFINNASRDNDGRKENADTAVGPVPNALITTTMDMRAGTITGEDGKYVLQYFVPPCPGFTFFYDNLELYAEIPYKSFNPKGRSVSRYTSKRPHSYFCNNLSAALAGSPTLSGQLTRIDLIGREATQANQILRADFLIDVIMLTGLGRMANILDNGSTEIIPVGGETKYKLPGFVSQISDEDMGKTDLYLFRESNGQLITSRENLTQEERVLYNNAGIVEGEAEFFYKFLVRGPRANDFARFGGTFEDLQAKNQINPELHARKSDHLRVGEKVKLVAINRPTGYIGTRIVTLGGAGDDGQVEESFASGILSFPIQDLILTPPNLKIKAIRTTEVAEGLTAEQENEMLVGSEGSALTSDKSVVVQTEWFDIDGTPLPSELDGYTGRVAKVVSEGVLASSGNDIANIEIKPGAHLEFVRLPNGLTSTTEHLYVQVVGTPSDRNPDFTSGAASDDETLHTRPKNFVPVKVPEFDAQSTIISEAFAAQEVVEEFNETLQEYDEQIEIYLSQLAAYNDAIASGDPNIPAVPTPPELPSPPVLENPEVIHSWVTRPEMHFSILDLKVNEIKVKTDSFGSTTDVDYDLTEKGGPFASIPALDRITGVEDAEGKLQRELLFMLGGYGALATIQDGSSDETIATLKLLGEQLDKVPASQIELIDRILQKLQPEDFLTLSLVQSDDAANALYEYAGLPLVIIPRFNAIPDFNLIPDSLRLNEYGSNPDIGQLADRRLKAPPITLTRTTQLGCFNDQVCSAGDRDIVDSFQLFPIYITQKSDLKVQVLDINSDTVRGTIIERRNVPPGTWNYVLTYDDIARFNINSIRDIDFRLKVTATPAQGFSAPSDLEVSHEIIHSGNLIDNFDNPILGSVLQHEVLIQRGQLSLRREDISLNGRGPQLSFIRSYTNQAQRGLGGVMGSGWSHNHDIKLIIDGYGDDIVANNIPSWVESNRGQLFRPSEIQDFEPPSKITITNAGEFKKVGGEWQAMRGFHGRIVETENNFEFRSKDGTLYSFKKPELRWIENITSTLESGLKPNLVPTRASFGDSLYSRLFIQPDTVAATLLDPYVSTTNEPILINPNLRFGPSAPESVQFIEDRNGNRMTYAYQQSYDGVQVKEIADAVGRKLTFNYEGFPVVTSSGSSSGSSDGDDPDIVDGVRVRGELDYEENRLAIQEPQQQSSGSQSSTSFIRIHDRLTSVTGPDNIVLNFEYEQHGINWLQSKFSRDVFTEDYEYEKEEQSFGYNIVSVADANNHVTQYTYKEPGQINAGLLQYVKSLNQEDLIDEVIYPDGEKAQFDYDHDQNHRTYTDLRGNPTVYELNEFGQPTRIVEPLNKITSFTWSIDEGADDVVMSSKTDAEGRTTRYEYDSQGNVTKEIDPYLNETITVWNQEFSLIESRTDRNGNTVSYEYNDKGNLILSIDAEEYETSHTYNELGERITTTDPRQNTTEYSYDQYGNLESITTPPVLVTEYKNGIVTTSSELISGVTQYVNDIRGRKVELTDPNGNTHRYVYDTLDRLIDTIDPFGFRNTSTYDAKGNKLTDVDKLGLKLTYEYDERDRVIKLSRNIGGTKNYTFDENSNVLTESDWIGRNTRFVYDELDRVVSKFDRLNQESKISYDLLNNITKKTDEEGREVEFTYDLLNRVVDAINADDDVMSYTYDNISNVLTEKDYKGRVITKEYDNRYLVTKVIDPMPGDQQGEMTYVYDGNGNEISMTDKEGRVTEYTYDAQNRKISWKDPNDFITSYEFDLNGNLSKETNRRGFERVAEYDALNRAIASRDQEGFVSRKAYDPNNNLIEKVDPRGGVSKYTYDILNRLITEKNPVGALIGHVYDFNGKEVRTKDARQLETRRFFDALDRVELVVEANNKSEQRVKEFTYDKVGNVLTERDYRGNVTAKEYDVLNRVIRIVDAENSDKDDNDPTKVDTRFEYDEVDNLVKTTDRRGHSIETEYDELNRPIRITDELDQVVTKNYDKEGNVVSEIDKRNVETTHVYDKLNRLISSHKKAVETDPAIRLVFSEYDGEGNAIAITDANGNREQYEYDRRNLKTKTIRPDSTVGSPIETTIVYDGNGNATDITNEVGQTITSTYDAANRLITVTNHANETNEYKYDLNNNRTQVKKPLGNTIRTKYDLLNRVVQVTDAQSGVSRYVYDGNDNVVTQTDANGNIVEYEYDKLNRRTKHTQLKPSSEDLVSTYEYDEENNQTAMVDAKGQRFETDYDELNRSIETRYHDASSNFYKPVRTVTSYDPNNNPISIIEHKLDENSVAFTDVCTMEYDLLNRMTQKVQRGYVLDTTYDDNGNKTSVTTNGGSTVYTFDSRNRIDTATQDGNVTTYHYRADSLQSKVEYPNDTETVYTYDDANRSKTVINQSISTQTLISSYIYDYDLNGNRIEQLEQQPSMTTSSRTTVYSFDANDRMISYTETNDATGDSLQYDYEYDANFNRIGETKTDTVSNAVTVTNRSYAYDETNWLSQITEDGETIDYTYDANGNTLTKIDNTGATPETTNFYYDSRNQLTQLTRGPPGLEINQGRYDYDYRGIRVRHKDSERGDVDYYHDDTAIIDEYTDNNTTLLAHYNYADRLLSLKTPTGEQYYHYSALRTTTNLTDNTGAIKVSYHTNPWGEITEQQGTSVNRQVFTGQEHDENTNLIYFGARYYDPDTARFITQDTYLGEFGTPPSLHRYLYAYSNPTAYIDPDGHVADKVQDSLNEIGDEAIEASKHLMKSDSYVDKAVGAVGAVSGGITKGVAWLAGVVNYAENQAINAVESTTGLVPDSIAAKAESQTQEVHEAVSNAVETLKSEEGRAAIANAAVEAVGGALSGDTDKIVDVLAFGGEFLVPGAALTKPVSTLGKATINVGKQISKSKLATKTSLTVERAISNGGNRVTELAQSASTALKTSAVKVATNSKTVLSRMAGNLMKPGPGKFRKQIGAVGDVSKIKLGRIKSSLKVPDLLIQSYSKLSKRKDIIGQAHHLNQGAAYKSIIPYSKGMTIKLRGNILKEANAPHTIAHRVMEGFWDTFRGTVIKPTNLQYTRALKESLKEAGLSSTHVNQAVRAAIRERVSHGALGGMSVPKVPGKIHNIAGG